MTERFQVTEFVVAMRFSFLGRSGWKSEFSRQREMLFDETRLRARLELFEKVALASLACQTDRGFHLFILTSEDLPAPVLARLQALCADTLGEGMFTIAPRPPGNARKFLRQFLDARHDSDPVVQIVLDDDDGLSCDFMADARERLGGLGREGKVTDGQSPYFISYASGYGLVFRDGSLRSPELYGHSYPYINLGLTMIGTRNGQNLFSIGHRKAPRRFGCLLVRKQPMFVRSLHDFNDSRAEQRDKWQALPDWRADAALLARFPYLANL